MKMPFNHSRGAVWVCDVVLPIAFAAASKNRTASGPPFNMEFFNAAAADGAVFSSLDFHGTTFA
jgi:hypothetical protein